MAKHIYFICDNCGKKGDIYMNQKQFDKLKHHFCCRECYHEYRRKHPEEYPGHPHSKAYEKLVALSKSYKKKEAMY